MIVYDALNGEITMILEKPAFRFLLFRTPLIMTNIWKFKLFPNPAGKTAITSIQLKRWRIDSSCSLFNVKPRPDSLSFNTLFNTFLIFHHCLCYARTNKLYFARKFVSCPNFRAASLRKIVSKLFCRRGTFATQANLVSTSWFRSPSTTKPQFENFASGSVKQLVK